MASFLLSSHLWPSAIKWGSLRMHIKIEESTSLQKSLFPKQCDAKWLLCNTCIRIRSLNITMYDIIQNNFTEIWAVIDYNVLRWVGHQGAKCSVTPLFFHIFIIKSLCCVFKLNRKASTCVVELWSVELALVFGNT